MDRDAAVALDGITSALWQSWQRVQILLMAICLELGTYCLPPQSWGEADRQKIEMDNEGSMQCLGRDRQDYQLLLVVFFLIKYTNTHTNTVSTPI